MNKLLIAVSLSIVIKEAILLFKACQWREIIIIGVIMLISVYLALDFRIAGQAIDKILLRYS
ncbi:MAG: hypothetical protein LBR98_07730 [Syntrophomonadaceae bacterium]|jgi:hypothetical protein|nr:hypothetical protein [Syntrophomonadaceae bacterium]